MSKSWQEVRLEWYLRRGYSIWKWNVTAYSWAGEYPPAFGYYPNVWLVRGFSVKKFSFKQFSSPSESTASEAAMTIMKGINAYVEQRTK